MQAEEIIENIQKIYSNYSIPTNLQRHMTTVACVAKQLSDNCNEKIDSNALIAAGLIHDLGNIVKMQFDEKHAAFLLDKEDFKKIGYFSEKQSEFREKYGLDDEEANLKIAKELGATKKVFELLKGHANSVREGIKAISEDFDAQILLYSDLRVSPNGVVPLIERLSEYAKRHSIDKDPIKIINSKEFVRDAIEMEKIIFKKMRIMPNEITQESTEKCLLTLLP